MIKYNPKDAALVWPEGDYQATLEIAEETVSKAGEQMHALTFTAYNGERTMNVRDYIVYPGFTWKLKRLARALGAEEEFKAGNFDLNEHQGRNLTLKLGIQPAKDGFDERNRVLGYAPKDGVPKTEELEGLPF